MCCTSKFSSSSHNSAFAGVYIFDCVLILFGGKTNNGKLISPRYRCFDNNRLLTFLFATQISTFLPFSLTNKSKLITQSYRAFTQRVVRALALEDTEQVNDVGLEDRKFTSELEDKLKANMLRISMNF